MKLLLIFALLVSLTIGLQEPATSEDSDLSVTKFNWTRRQQEKHFVYGSTEGLLPSRVPNPREPRTSEERKMDNASAEAKVVSASEKKQVKSKARSSSIKSNTAISLFGNAKAGRSLCLPK